jgi:hypothetical protein
MSAEADPNVTQRPATEDDNEHQADGLRSAAGQLAISVPASTDQKAVPPRCPRTPLNSQQRPATTEPDRRSGSAVVAGMALNGTDS